MLVAALNVASITGSPRLLPLKCKLTRTTAIFVSRWASPNIGFNSLQLSCRKKNTLPARKLLVRAARTESQGASLGFRAPHFELPEPLTGKMWKLEDFEPYPALLIILFVDRWFRLDSSVMFICNHCPFVKHLKKDIVKLTNFYMKKGLAVIAISSNSVATHPHVLDGPEFMAEEAKIFNYPFPYLHDESQDIARDFRAVCTSEFFLFKKKCYVRCLEFSKQRR